MNGGPGASADNRVYVAPDNRELCRSADEHESTTSHAQALPINVAPSSFWSSVDRSGGPGSCWPWVGIGGHDTAGYGQGTFGWTRKAHREAYRLVHPDFDRALDVLHTCDNPPCVNPAHLFIGTPRDNLRDAARKGRLGRRPLNWGQVQAMRAAWRAGASQRELTRRFGVSQAMVSYIVNGKRWPEPAA